MKKWYEKLFENYANNYEKEIFTQGTLGEVDFLEQELNHNKNAKILDIGCGTGRHSLELARRGYKNLTGFDLSDNMLNTAIERAKAENLNVEFLKMNAVDFNFNKEYDLAMILCEGAFPLMETDEMNFRILKNMSDSLKDGGKFILTTLNALYPLTNSNEDIPGYGKSEFDYETMRDHFEYNITDDSGKNMKIVGNDRYYMPTEIKWYLKGLGFNKVEIFGAKIGAFSRDDELTCSDFEMLVIAEK